MDGRMEYGVGKRGEKARTPTYFMKRWQYHFLSVRVVIEYFVYTFNLRLLLLL